jgi:hypothetical protein
LAESSFERLIERLTEQILTVHQSQFFNSASASVASSKMAVFLLLNVKIKSNGFGDLTSPLVINCEASGIPAFGLGDMVNACKMLTMNPLRQPWMNGR